MPSMKNENPTLPVSAAKAYLLAARPKTWIASISPICIGSVLADSFDTKIFILTLLFCLLIQIGTNFANDYFDYMKGADTPLRKGPKRAVNEGWITPVSMLRATCLVFSLSLLIASPLIWIAGLWSLCLAALFIALGVFYTGGPKPLGYLGLGEFFVLIFFGPVATCGTYYLQTHSLTLPVFIASLAPGLLSCSLLIANNLRDEETDRRANKWTLIVRFGRLFGAFQYTFAIVAATAIPPLLVYLYQAPVSLLTASLILPIAFPYIKKTFTFSDPLELMDVLQGSALLLFFYTVLFCLALY